MKNLERAKWGLLYTLIIMTGIAVSDDRFGPAPQSLDLYTLNPRGTKASASADRTSIERPAKESDPFQKVSPPALDPQNGKRADRIVVGPTHRFVKAGPFDAYRFVTYLTYEERKERLYDLPIRHQECSARATAFADYDYSTTIETQVDSHLSREEIGLAKKGEPRSKPFVVRQVLKASPREIADHVPYVVKKSAQGRSYLQLIQAETGKVKTVVSANENGIDLEGLFPSIFGGAEVYPLPVEVKDLEWKFVVDRVPVRKCTTAEVKQATQRQQAQASL